MLLLAYLEMIYHGLITSHGGFALGIIIRIIALHTLPSNVFDVFKNGELAARNVVSK